MNSANLQEKPTPFDETPEIIAEQITPTNPACSWREGLLAGRARITSIFPTSSFSCSQAESIVRQAAIPKRGLTPAGGRLARIKERENCMKQLRPLFEWVALIAAIAGYIQVYSESGSRRSPLYEMNDFVYSTDITSKYYQELEQAGLVPSFDAIGSPFDYCPDMYPTARASYRGALLAADCYLSRNKTQQALDFLDIAIQADGTQVEAWYYRGLLYLSLNQYTQGQSSLRQALNATSDAVWRSRIKRELFFSTMNVWAPLPFAVGTIFIVGLEIAKNLGAGISSKKWAAVLIGIAVIWAVSFIFMSMY